MQATTSAPLTPGTKTSEFKIALLTMGATAGLAVLKVAGLAVLATGAWWALPASLALTSFGYSLSRGLAKRGVVIQVATVKETPATAGV